MTGALPGAAIGKRRDRPRPCRRRRLPSTLRVAAAGPWASLAVAAVAARAARAVDDVVLARAGDRIARALAADGDARRHATRAQ